MSNDTIMIQIPNIETWCPICDANMLVPPIEWETINPETLATATVWCDECSELITVELVS